MTRTTVTLCRGWDGAPILTINLKVSVDPRPAFKDNRYIRLPGIATGDGYRAVHTHGDIERAFVDDREVSAIYKAATRYGDIYSPAIVYRS